MSELKILFAGDYAPCKGFEKLVLNDREKIFNDFLDIIKLADIAFLNLECPLTRESKAIQKTGPALKADPKAAESIAMAGFNLIGLANNHIMDYGEPGLSETIDALKGQSLNFVGAGFNLKAAQEPFYKEVQNIKTAIIALAEQEFSQADTKTSGVAPLDLIDNFHQIQVAKSNAELVFVTLHAGNEFFPFPSPGLRKKCRFLLELGADAVICHHPHVPGAYELVNGKPIIYSLGNLLFDGPAVFKDWDIGYMVNLVYNSETRCLDKIDFFPYRQSVECGGIKALKESERDMFLERLESYRKALETEKEWEEAWKTHAKQQSATYIIRNYSPLPLKAVRVLASKTPLAHLLIRKDNILERLNLIRCQSHRELLLKILELKSSDFFF